MHIALLGDSTFDNRAYTEGGPDVVAHLNRLLVPPDHATLLAVDGGTVADVYAQLEDARPLVQRDEDPVTHIALSVGGNDLLGIADVLNAKTRSVAEGLLVLRETAAQFGDSYRELLDDVLELGAPTIICAVYHGAFEDPVQAAVIETALRVFDHEIIEAGLARGLPIVDLRRVCTSAEDYWNPIEPSEKGGGRVAAAVLGAFRAPRYDFGGPAVTIQGTGGLAG